MRDELYIDGTKVDMGESGVSLEYRSNILTDISKIVSNFSYTIKLPKTKNNLRLIECAHIPSAVSSFPYLPHVGTLLRDGVQIVDGANVVLMSVSDTIEIALSWGNATGFSKIIEFEGNLDDLDYGIDDYIFWRYDISPDENVPIMNYGFRSTEKHVSYHPVVSAKWLLDRIQSQFGVNLLFPSDKQDVLQSLKIPLLKKEDAQKHVDANRVALTLNGLKKTDGALRVYQLMFYGLVSSYYVEYYSDSVLISAFKPKFNNMQLNYSIDCKLIYVGSAYKNGGYLDIVDADTGEIIDQVNAFEVIDRGNENYECHFKKDLSLEPYDKTIYISTTVSKTGDDSVSLVSGSITLEAKVSEVGADIGEYNKFFTIPNLPSIKLIDFVKSIAYMLGVFAVPGDNNDIRFISFDTVIENKSNAVDWSGRVLINDYGEVARNISYQLNDFTQKNWFRYKEDDNVTENYDSFIAVENRALDYERDAVSLPFSACDTLEGVASIPMYSYNDDGELEYDSGMNPRIVLYDSETRSGVFYPLRWEELIRQHYASYQEVVRQPKVIKELVLLSAPELAVLDLLKPVYIRQYGSYFAIVKVKTKENNICEVELLKI
ncbi:hypothetical protein [Phocaeicola plebeius]|mgnify:FL=1|jgi:hypothetical protein|uniref:hypothetical protein n=1 Tax=Phocaeicola plebeius TaxID=310297 RepID=UPI0026ED3F82|nr:hypothetical protein [Phocaeicola plebeius]MCI6050056.1 hypothetical protein [Phocaeicola plebeius]MDD6914049.1 hypothetical protein [Phocaeicola plebeius]MDY5979471.1 hypothetical protein [Phocaeicola plebeius]